MFLSSLTVSTKPSGKAENHLIPPLSTGLRLTRISTDYNQPFVTYSRFNKLKRIISPQSIRSNALQNASINLKAPVRQFKAP